MEKLFLLVSVLVAGCFLSAKAQPATTNDLWDLKVGTKIITNTPVRFSINGIFGGNPSGPEAEHTVFADGKPPGFVHSVTWKTAAPTFVNAARIFAAGDGPVYGNEREFASVTISGKLLASDDFQDLLTFVPEHPYQFIDVSSLLILDQQFPSFTGQYFKADFLQFTSGQGYDGPRIVELDGFFNTPGLSISPTNPLFTNSVSVNATATDPNAVVRYTLDGSDPIAASAAFTSPLVLTQATFVKIGLFVDGASVQDPVALHFIRQYVTGTVIPDAWYRHYFGADYLFNPLAAYDADPDGDGRSNLDEYLNNSDPFDPNNPAIRLVPLISWTAVDSRLYRILKEDTVQGPFTPLMDFFSPTNSTMTFIDTQNTNPAAFYRIDSMPKN